MELNLELNRTNARKAGAWYLLLAAAGIFAHFIVRMGLIVPKDPAATLESILAAEGLFRFGIIADLTGQIAFLMLGFTFYRLFVSVDRLQASLLLLFVAVSVPAAFLNTLSQYAVLLVSGGGALEGVFDPAQRQALAYLFLQLQEYGIYIIQPFWGLWLLPLGILFLRSGVMPRLLGVLLIAGCGFYLIDTAAHLLYPAVADTVTAVVMVPAVVAELGTVGWLLTAGVRRVPSGAPV